jgi:hypothetical protein
MITDGRPLIMRYRHFAGDDWLTIYIPTEFEQENSFAYQAEVAADQHLVAVLDTVLTRLSSSTSLSLDALQLPLRTLSFTLKRCFMDHDLFNDHPTHAGEDRSHQPDAGGRSRRRGRGTSAPPPAPDDEEPMITAGHPISFLSDGFIALPPELVGDSIPGYYDHPTHGSIDEEAVVELEYAQRSLAEPLAMPSNELEYAQRMALQ